MGLIKATRDKSVKAATAAAKALNADSTRRPSKVAKRAETPMFSLQPPVQPSLQLQQAPPVVVTTAGADTLTSSLPWWVSDVSFNVEGKVIQAHKVVLASRSVYFAQLFQTSPLTCFVIAEFSHETFQYFIRWLYAGAKDVPASAAPDLLKCAQMYDVPDLLLVCERALVALAVDTQTYTSVTYDDATRSQLAGVDGMVNPDGLGLQQWSHDPMMQV